MAVVVSCTRWAIADAKTYLDAAQLSDLTDILFTMRSIGVEVTALIEAQKNQK